MKKEQYVPFKAIYERLMVLLPTDCVAALPTKWELLGDVLLLKIPKELEEWERQVAAEYAKELKAKTVVKDCGIGGRYRVPAVKVLFGKETETTHHENKVRFRLDVSKIMFSSGNIEERMRMAEISNPSETVVDMFAGIGYFAIPIAKHSRPRQVFASEINETAYRYLCENIKMNKVQQRVTPLLGDCLEVAPEGVGDRVVMGCLDSYEYIDKALKVLCEGGGVIHYHEACPNELLPDRPIERVKKAVLSENRSFQLIQYRVVKSYAPGVSHVVLDVKVS